MRRTVPIERLQDLWTESRTLTAVEVEERRRRFGKNEILESAPGRWREILRDSARDPMLWFLAGTGSLYALVGERIEAATLFAAIAPLVGMDAFLHRRTQAATEGLKSRLAITADVIRDGFPVTIPATELVPGDLMIVSSGEPFPADGILLGGDEVQVDESTLTGESYPVRKRPLAKIDRYGSEPAIEDKHWGFAGTLVLTGRPRLRVVFTGGETLYGEIVRSALRGAGGRTPLQSAIAGLVSLLTAAASVLCMILAFVRLSQGHGWVDSLVSALTLAVAALPEEFPVVFTFFLGAGVYRLARRRALVRRAVSVENIGRATSILTDKTGTITEGRLRLMHVHPAEAVERERLLFLAAAACRPEGGDPLDMAVYAAMREAGKEPPLERLAVFPFTEARKHETAIARDEQGVAFAAVKGAAEVVFRMSGLNRNEREAWNERVVRFAEEGHKVVACAWRAIDVATWAGGEPDRGYRLAGLLAFEDPVREGVARAIESCRQAGIHPVMVTGDHPATARAVAREIGLGTGDPVILLGDEVEEQLACRDGRLLLEADVVARAVPAQKLAMVRALQELGEIVVVTGDGVNDVPALQDADVGIAMGERGTRSAREVAAIVLLDDNFRTIVGAIAEGRQLFRNLQTSFLYLLFIHIPFVVTAAAIPFAGYPLLYLPIHIVWLEMIIHPTAMLVFQSLPATEAFDTARPRPMKTFFSRRDWLLVVVIGGLLTVFVLTGYLRSLGIDGDVEHARAMALAILTFSSGTLAAALTRLRTRISRWISGATLALSTLLIQTPSLAAFLHLRSLHPDDWIAVLAASVITSFLAWASRTAPRSPGRPYR